MTSSVSFSFFFFCLDLNGSQAQIYSKSFCLTSLTIITIRSIFSTVHSGGCVWPVFLSIAWIKVSPHIGLIYLFIFFILPGTTVVLIDYSVVSGLYSLSSAQGCRFCRAYREELWAHSGSDTADSPRDFWRADCCSCRMSRLACWRSASRSSAVCLLKEDRRLQKEMNAYISKRKVELCGI